MVLNSALNIISFQMSQVKIGAVCGVCLFELSTLDKEEGARGLNSFRAIVCSHVFHEECFKIRHKTCISRQPFQKPICPLCRSLIDDTVQLLNDRKLTLSYSTSQPSTSTPAEKPSTSTPAEKPSTSTPAEVASTPYRNSYHFRRFLMSYYPEVESPNTNRPSTFLRSTNFSRESYGFHDLRQRNISFEPEEEHIKTTTSEWNRQY
jgi:hypothetical protein